MGYIYGEINLNCYVILSMTHTLKEYVVSWIYVYETDKFLKSVTICHDPKLI